MVTVDVEMLEQGIGVLSCAPAGWRRRRKGDVLGVKSGEGLTEHARDFRIREAPHYYCMSE